MFSNLTGWHLLIVIAVIIVPLLLAAATIAIVVAVVRRSRRAKRPADGTFVHDGDPGARLAQLDDLRRRNRITETEYEARRRAIVDRL